MAVFAPIQSPGGRGLDTGVTRSSPALSEKTVVETFAKGNTPAPKKPIKIVVVADVVCMWSYVALREMTLTIKEIAQKWRQAGRPIPHFDIEFRPFFLFPGQLDDDVPVDRESFLEDRWGKEQAALNKDLVAKRGLELGIHFQFKGKIRQTTRAHRLLYLAYQRGGTRLQQQLLEELYQSYWVRGLDLGSVPLLASIASRLGLMPYDTAVLWIESKAGEAEVKRLAAISNECGIAGCPFIVIEGKWAICGGERKEVLSQTLEKVLRNEMS